MRSLLILTILISTFLYAQEIAADTTISEIAVDSLVSDTVSTDISTTAVLNDTISADTSDAIVAGDTISDSVVTEIPDTAGIEIVEVDTTSIPDSIPEVIVEEQPTAPIGPLPMELSYGYKGFRWGSPIGSVPRFAYADSIISQDSLKVIIAAKLGPDVVRITYHFADSGFWKVDIDFSLVQDDIDAQIEQFLRIEKSMSEIYGYPTSTNQLYNGPTPSYNDILDVNFSRAFYRSGWLPIPVRIELLLSGIVQHTGSVLPVFEGDFSLLKLVYYNPDYMYFRPISERAEKIPSIFDIY